MLENFERYLIEQGYSTETPSGHSSTVYDYKNRVQKVCQRENITINQLADNITHYVQRYDEHGAEAEFGSRSHKAYINALKRFEEFTRNRLIAHT